MVGGTIGERSKLGDGEWIGQGKYHKEDPHITRESGWWMMLKCCQCSAHLGA